MAQAIQTHYLGPTNNRPARLVDKCDAGRVVVSWDYAHDVQRNHELACLALRKKLDTGSGGTDFWTSGEWRSGSLTDGSYVHVWVPGHD